MSDTTPSSVTGDPTGGTVALLAVVVILLGILDTGIVPAASAGLFVPVLLLAGIGMLLLGLLAVRKGDNIIGLFFSTFGPFVASFGLLIAGLLHGWWAIPPADIPHAEAAFLMSWTIVLTVWFFLSFVLPAIFTMLLTFVDIALWCLVIGIWNTSAGPQKVAGYLLLATGAGALYFGAALWLGWLGVATLPVGRPLIRRSQPAAVAAPTPTASVSLSARTWTCEFTPASAGNGQACPARCLHQVPPDRTRMALQRRSIDVRRRRFHEVRREVHGGGPGRPRR